MDNKIRKLLTDIIGSINNIDSYIGEEKKFDIYDNNQMLQDAVERNIEIIGEAVNKLLDIEPDIAITNARRIVDARNKIIHGYDEIENTQIWAVIINHLPLLYEETENLLKNG
jgi:uncharacterized protein with HEPN domain